MRIVRKPALIVLLFALLFASCSDWNHDMKEDIKRQVAEAQAGR